MRKQLTSFDIQTLECIIKELGSVPRIFNSEAQFQFELAWKIKEEFDCEVKLEELSRASKVTNSTGRDVVKKDYTDIILEKEDCRIAIELKYKTAEPKNFYIQENVLLMNHGAADLGAYDFMWDIHRIQVLTGWEQDNSTVKMLPCTRGYAVILTNEPRYWNTNSNNNVPEKGINRQFLIGEDKDKPAYFFEGEHCWYTKEGEKGLSKALQNDKSRQKSINIINNYPYKWKNYCEPIAEKNGLFRFMIVEIDSNCKKS